LDVFTAVAMKKTVFWDVDPYGSCKNRRFGVTNRLHHQGANVAASSPILVTFMMEAIFPPNRRFLQEPHGVTSQKTAFFNVNTVLKYFPIFSKAIII
jgi:hypothetical protein